LEIKLKFENSDGGILTTKQFNTCSNAVALFVTEIKVMHIEKC